MLEKFVPWWELEKIKGKEDRRKARTRYSEDYLHHLEDDFEPTSWEPKNLEHAVRHPSPPESPRFFSRSDGAKLIYPRRAHSFIGESESMKTWAAIAVALDVARSGRGVVYVDCETSLDIFAGRFGRMGGLKYVENVAYVRPDEPLYDKVGYDAWSPTAALQELEAVFNAWHAELVVLDGVTEIMAMHAWNINDAADVARYHKVLLRRWSGEIATLEVDHVAKGDFTGDTNFIRSALGSQHKRAGIDGASYLFIPVKKSGQGGRSESMVKLLKDREGGSRVNQLSEQGDMGMFVIDSSGEGDSIKVSLEAKGDTGMDVGMVLLTAIKELPGGNNALAGRLHLDAKKVRDTCLLLEAGGHIKRGEQDRWFVVEEEDE